MTPLQHLFWAILNSLWQSAALAGIAFVALRVRRSTAAQRYAVWAAVLLACAILPMVDLVVPVRTFSIRSAPAAKPVAASPVTFTVHAPSGIAPTLALSARSPVSSMSLPPPPTMLPVPTPLPTIASRWLQERLADAFIVAWCIVAFALVLRLVAGYAMLRRSRRALVYRELNADERHALRAITRRPVAVGLSESIGEPCVIGFVRPVISLPAVITKTLPSADLARVMRHECAHISRWDDYGNLVQHAISAIFWFNPIVHMISRALDVDREIACDDAVASLESDRIEFAKCLYQIARGNTRGRWLPAAGFARNRSQIVLRIAELLDRNHRASTALGIGAKFAAIAILIAAVPAGYMQMAALAAPAAPEHPAIAALPAHPAVAAEASAPAAAEASAPAARAAFPAPAASAPRAHATRVAPAAPVVPARATSTAAPSAPANTMALTSVKTTTLVWLPATGNGPRHAHVLQRILELHGPSVSELVPRATHLRISQLAPMPEGDVIVTPVAVAPLPSVPVAVVRIHGSMIVPRARGDGAANAPDDFLAALHDAGFTNLSVDDLIAIRNAGVSGSFIRALHIVGLTPMPAKELEKLADAGVSPQFLAETRRAGFAAASVDDLIALSNAGVSGKFMQSLAAARLLPMSTQDIIKLANEGVDAQFVLASRTAGYALSADDLARLRNAGADSGYLVGLRSLGYQNVSVTNLIAMLDAGVSLDFIRRINASHIDGAHIVPVEDLIKLRNAGV
jgi:beta-lactamase regulating signal transducer with metallopeptidase domain